MLKPQKRIFSSGTEDNVSGLGGWVINVDEQARKPRQELKKDRKGKGDFSQTRCLVW